MVRRDFLKFRVIPEEEQRWRAAADASGQNLSAWLRGVADLAAAGAGAVNPAEVRDALVRFRADLNRGVGNNLNQLARALNGDLLAEKEPSASACEAALTRAAEDLSTMRAALQQALGGLSSRRRPPRHRRPGVTQSPDTATPVSRDAVIPSSRDTTAR